MSSDVILILIANRRVRERRSGRGLVLHGACQTWSSTHNYLFIDLSISSSTPPLSLNEFRCVW